MEMQHTGHKHSLSLREEKINGGIPCSLCRRFVDNPCYVCDTCKCYLHIQCAEISSEFPQEISNVFHPQHSLFLKLMKNYWCSSCHKQFQDALCFCCYGCNVYFDVKCALMPYVDLVEQECVRHFSHQHSLTQLNKEDDTGIECFACKTGSSDNALIYGCIHCEYFLHKSCIELPKMIFHSMHPRHALAISVSYGECRYCRVSDYSFKYKCEKCHYFLMHVKCALVSITEYEDKGQQMTCFLCNKDRFDRTHLCVAPMYYLNQSCIKLPEVLKHSFHPHDLRLANRSDFYCDSCHKRFKNVTSYYCDDCDFDMDIRCALMESIRYEDQVVMQHFSHQHLLTELKMKNSICWACKEKCSGSMFACVICQFFLHKSCAEIPEKINHPFHPQHPLTYYLGVGERTCDACLRISTGLFFECESCDDFCIGADCIKLKPTIDYKYHDHPLCVIDRQYELPCCAYSTPCEFFKSSTEFRLLKSAFLCCVDCKFNVHLSCGPLPSTIKHNCHIHELKLMDSVVEDDSDEYYCDVCEEERDPRICVYYCEKCNFISHMNCVRVEVENALRKEPKEVELRIVGERRVEKKFEQNVITDDSEESKFQSFFILKDILDSLTEDEIEKLETIFPNAPIFEGRERKEDGIVEDEDNDDNNTESDEEDDNTQESDEEDDTEKADEEDNTQKVDEGKTSDDIMKFSPYSNDFLRRLLLSIYPCTLDIKSYINSKEWGLKLAKVGGYMITINFENTLETILSTHGDLSTNSSLNRKCRSVVYYILCRVVNDMRRTYVVDITKDLLSMWEHCISCVEDAGFDVDFTYDYSCKVLTAFMGLQVMKYDDEIPVQLDQRIVELDEKIVYIGAELERVKKWKEKFKSLLEKPKPQDLKDYLKQFKALKWRTAGDGYF